MLNKNKPAIIVAALLSVASSVMAASAQPQAQGFAGPTAADLYPTSPGGNRLVGLPANRNGDVVDRQGWRLLDGNWENTCFRTLDYLPSESACSGAAGY